MEDLLRRPLPCRSTVITCTAGAFILGIAVHTLIAPTQSYGSEFFWYSFALLSLTLGVILCIFSHHKSFIALIPFLFAVVALGFWRYEFSLRSLPSSLSISSPFRGIILDDVTPQDSYTNAIVTVEHSSTKITVHAPIFPELRYGDKVKIICNVETAPDYFLSRSIYYQCPFPKSVTIEHRGEGNHVMARLLFIKHALQSSLHRIVPEPESSLMDGVLLGDASGLPRAIRMAFRSTGTSHVFALSGFNITILTGAVMAFLIFCSISRRYAFPVATAMIIAFVLATGAQASIVRAGVMGILLMLAHHSGRIARARVLLAVACATLLATNPYLLRFDLGFQLSFAATAGLMLFSTDLKKFFTFIPSHFSLRDNTASSTAALLATTPLLVWKGGTVTLLALPVNLLIIPAIPILMALGFIAGLLGLVATEAGRVVGWFAVLPARYILTVVTLFARL